jgi:hypothetical protein
MTRILSIDAGMTVGYAAVGNHQSIVSGSRTIRGSAVNIGPAGRHFDEVMRHLILDHRPDLIVYASPFVGSRAGRPVQPNSIRPLMSFLTLIDMIGDELKIKTAEIDEPAARRAFLDKVPRKSEEIKQAILNQCSMLGLPCPDHHAGDAICVGLYALFLLEEC